ncbi:hypothetical protein QCD60_24190 [Pokkaliibacter sp. MBI-7]|uniref:hypothetical protein n=1 Tax=Pokkaliibacter sp. MBI-7 TaxID=3040600 RepID=UPI00244BE726|nr:hypothetical protein [Pokkaliibacter sp. MBI-7]MDH2435630.1 hypothetical protein [Pokkaliibacter sp. MBI-7]
MYKSITTSLLLSAVSLAAAAAPTPAEIGQQAQQYVSMVACDPVKDSFRTLKLWTNPSDRPSGAHQDIKDIYVTRWVGDYGCHEGYEGMNLVFTVVRHDGRSYIDVAANYPLLPHADPFKADIQQGDNGQLTVLNADQDGGSVVWHFDESDMGVALKEGV